MGSVSPDLPARRLRGRAGILPKPYDLLRFSEVVAKARRWARCARLGYSGSSTVISAPP
jgi:hypothetical protein